MTDRRGIVDDKFKWSDTQTFKAYKIGNRVAANTHPISDVLSAPVRLTKMSEHDPEKSLAGQTVRLLKNCVVTLRLYCKKHKPALIRSDVELEEEEDEGDEEGEDSEEEEESSEEEEEEEEEESGEEVEEEEGEEEEEGDEEKGGKEKTKRQIELPVVIHEHNTRRTKH